MKDILIRCYYDDMTIAEAIDFIESVYNKTVAKLSLNSALKQIKNDTGEDWK